MNTWTVPRDWPGETVFILGGGPSLRGFDAALLAGRRVIAINNSWELKPDADVLYFCDAGWWRVHGEHAKAGFRGEHIVTLSDARDARLKRLRNAGKVGLAIQPFKLVHGTNSGYQAINLAVHFGAARIVLLGYDMRTEGDRTHWHAGHGRAPEHHAHMMAKVFLPYFEKLVEPLRELGIEVINVTPGSALKLWPIRTLEEILQSEAVCV